ncbi:MAG: sensor histidine kinase, partial [Chloroflexota bacterium]
MERNYRNGYIEPGLLEAFRFYYIMRTVLGVVLFTVLLLQGIAARVIIIGVTTGLLTLLYLSHEGLQRRLGRYYLPAGFIFAIVETHFIELFLKSRIETGLPIISNFLVYISGSEATLGSPQFSILVHEAWMASPPLFFLLIFVAWQYSFRQVVMYAIALAAINMLFPAKIGETPGTQFVYNLTINFMRTMSFMMIGYLITRLVEAQRQHRRELMEARSKVANYAAMVENLAITRERNRMAREMHDTLAHTLSATSVQLEAVNSLWDADEQKAQSMLQRALGTTRNGLTETRRALQDMRASPLEELGLVLAIKELGETTQVRCGSAVTLNVPEKIEELSFEIEQTVYRVTQETLENAVRHANAKNVTVNVQQIDDRLRVEICDDGRGFDMATVDMN